MFLKRKTLKGQHQHLKNDESLKKNCFYNEYISHISEQKAKSVISCVPC